MSQLLLSTLGVVCPNCDEYNAAKTAKCTNCGTALYVNTRMGERPAAAGAPGIARGGTSPGLPAKPQPPASPSPGPAPIAIPLGMRPSPTSPAKPVVVPPGGSPLSPPGMRPAAKPEPAPTPASELVKKPAPSKFGLLVLGGASKGQRFRLAGTTCQVGRGRGAILFQDDPFVSNLHATFVIRDNALLVKDEGSASGVFVAIPGQESIGPNTYFSAGHRLFRFTGALNPPPQQPGAPIVYGAPAPSGHSIFGVEEWLVGGRPGRGVVSAGPLLTIGQSLCDLSFARDEGMATRHCEISPSGNGATLRDLSGGLGTFVKITGERMLNYGDRVRIGEHILQVEA